jgi:hypothetical protein
MAKRRPGGPDEGWDIDEGPKYSVQEAVALINQHYDYCLTYYEEGSLPCITLVGSGSKPLRFRSGTMLNTNNIRQILRLFGLS